MAKTAPKSVEEAFEKPYVFEPLPAVVYRLEKGKVVSKQVDTVEDLKAALKVGWTDTPAGLEGASEDEEDDPVALRAEIEELRRQNSELLELAESASGKAKGKAKGKKGADTGE